MVEVKIRCPVCSKSGYIGVEENLLKNSDRGISAVNIGALIICKHSFIVYIDRNLTIRDSFTTDFTVELPKFKIKKKIDIEIPISQDIDLFLLSINIQADKLSSIFRAIFFKKKILIVNDLDVIEDHFHKLTDYIYQESFKINLSFIKSSIYKERKKEFKDYIIFYEDKIINDKKKLIKPGKIERIIVREFLSIPDTEASLITLKNEMTKAFLLSNEFCDSITKYSQREENEVIEGKDIIESIEKKFNTELSFDYVIFLIEIIENYFEIKVPMSWKFFLIRPRK